VSAWVLLLLVFSSLWLFWAWLSALFDWIHDYQHPELDFPNDTAHGMGPWTAEAAASETGPSPRTAVETPAGD
jgi:hypothetical protein